jgi:hypothetical protein
VRRREFVDLLEFQLKIPGSETYMEPDVVFKAIPDQILVCGNMSLASENVTNWLSCYEPGFGIQALLYSRYRLTLSFPA